ncbi:MAG: endonuclease III [Hyphomicrobiaceae bacterium]
MPKPPRLPAHLPKAVLDARPEPLRAWPRQPAGPDQVEKIFRRFAAANPEPKAELEHHDPFTLLVAVVLSAQATDAGVNKATRGLFKAAATPAEMVALGEAGVQERIKTIGLYRNKAKNVIALSQRLMAEHGGKVPRERAALEALPGVGRKTANVVLNIAFGEPTLAVDTHVFRVAHRLGLAKGKTPLDVELSLLKVIPEKYMRHAHHWLILHGRYVCQARKPRCDVCIVSDLCRSPDKWFDGPPPKRAAAAQRLAARQKEPQ